MKITDTLKHGDIMAQHYRLSLGGAPLICIESTNCADESELILSMDEAKALHEWLGRAISGSGEHSTKEMI